MAKDGNTYAKRQRETLKRQKAEAKRDRRQKRIGGIDVTESSPGMDVDSDIDRDSDRDIDRNRDIDHPAQEVVAANVGG